MPARHRMCRRHQVPRRNWMPRGSQMARTPVADRVSRLGAGPRRWRPTGRALVFAIVGAAILAAMAWAVLGSRLLVVRTVRVAGAGRTISTAQVLAAAHISHGLP